MASPVDQEYDDLRICRSVYSHFPSLGIDLYADTTTEVISERPLDAVRCSTVKCAGQFEGLHVSPCVTR